MKSIMHTRFMRYSIITTFVFFACAVPLSRAHADPVVSTEQATFISGSGATLNGMVDLIGNGSATPTSPTFAWFQYSVDPNFTFTFPPKVYYNELGTINTDCDPMGAACPYSYRIEGLSSSRLFYYRVCAEQEASAVICGNTVTFTTAAALTPPPQGTQLPDVSTLPATDITSTSAVLHGTTNPHGFDTIAWFNYALNSSFDQSANSVLFEDEGNGTTDKSFSYSLTGLAPNTTYYYRAGATHGEPAPNYSYFTQNFTTLADGQIPTTTTTTTTTGQPPVIVGPVIQNTGAIVTCTANCGYNELIQMIQRIISFLLFDLSLPLAAAIFMYAGWLYMTSGGDSTKVKKAHHAFMAVFKGLVVALAAWLIINTLLTSLLTPEALQNGANLLKQ